MTSNANTNSGRDKITGIDNSPASPIERRTISSTYSSSNHRYSYASNETGESSTSVSNTNSLAINTDKSAEDENARNGADISQPGVKDSRSNHRSHRKRQSGGFLLSNTTFDQHPHKPFTSEHLPRQRESSDDHKGKGKLPQSGKRHTKKRSNLGLGIGGSPLASNVTTADTGNANGNRPANGRNEEATSVPSNGEGDKTSETKETPNTLDVDSAQIVNLALNLSESRRNAARRNVSVPLTPSTGFTEGFAGGSLRQHLQQQRKVSRNISPKPDRNERASTTSPRLLSGQKVNSPLQSAFESTQDSPYQYNFSASTLARAEKAKNAIELMAQYRRLLQYVPPLKPQALERPATASPTGTPSGSPTASTFSPVRTASTTNSTRVLGREYNPLQYIRNRKVRGRERKGIDGEAQGFGDLEKVLSWVDQLSRSSFSEDRQTADCLPLPNFSQAARDAASPHTSPQSSQGNGKPASVKIKRPRIDWVTNPADMIADVFWLEQDDNKKIIEDRHGRKIFPQITELKRPASHQSENPEMPVSPGREDADHDLRIDTKILPEFKSMKSDSEKSLDHAASRAKQRFREATRIHHGHNGSTRESRLLSHSRSDSDSSESDSRLRRNQTRRKRSGTANSHDGGKDILEKQMMEMLAKEARDCDWGTTPGTEGQQVIQSIETQKLLLKDTGETSGAVSGRHSRSASRVIYRRGHTKRESLRNGSSGRPSLEVPGSNPRSSFEEFDSTAPSSPETRATKVANSFIPPIGMDLSPSHSRQASPTRNPLSRVRSKINMSVLHDRTRDHSRGREGTDEAASTKNSPAVVEGTDSPVTPERLKRSKSPVKKMISRRTDESSTSMKSRAGSLRGKSGEESSGIRGLFKTGRGAVAKVSDVLWKKDPSPGFGTSSGVSSDDSDVEDSRNVPAKDGRGDNSEEQPSSLPVEMDDISPQKERQSFLSSMPTFTSPFERRGRERLIPSASDPTSAEEDYILRRQQTREERRKLSMLEQPPRIDVQNASPTLSPDLRPPTHFRLDSDASDIDSFRSGYSNGVHNADARLNAILGLPGKRRDQLPVTGLSQLETTHEKRPSIEGKRRWSISDRGISSERGPMTQREIARVRALLLSSGIKAKEIGRRSIERRDLRNPEKTSFSDIANLTKELIPPVPKSQEHILAARILSTDIQLSTRMWQTSADNFSNTTINGLLGRVEGLQSRISDNLTPMARKAADEADDVSKDLMTSQTLAVKRLSDMMDKMLRRRRRRFRWLRRGGWVLVEWALVGVMWWVWFIVVLARIVIGSFKGVVAFLRWLFWL